MRRGRVFLYLAFLLILFAIAGIVIWQNVLGGGKQPKKTPTPTPAPKVMVLTQSLKQGDVISAEVLAAMPWPGGVDLSLVFQESQKNELIGRQLKYELSAGTPIFKSFLISQGEQISMYGSAWALNIPPGMVAISMPINALAAVSYAPRPGDHVNVMVTVQFIDLDTQFQSMLPNMTGIVTASGPPDPVSGTNNRLTVLVSPNLYGRVEIDPVLGQAVYLLPIEAQRPRMTSQLILQDAVVLQIGQFPLQGQESKGPTATPDPKTKQTTQKEATPAVSEPLLITLLVTPQDAVTLNFLIFQDAQLTLALRNPNDNSRVQINPVTLQFLLEQYQIPVPVRLPYGLFGAVEKLYLPTPAPSK
jgi:Flp pilus assembly protein CpaB